jgi:hypothetical protein
MAVRSVAEPITDEQARKALDQIDAEFGPGPLLRWALIGAAMASIREMNQRGGRPAKTRPNPAYDMANRLTTIVEAIQAGEPIPPAVPTSQPKRPARRTQPRKKGD